jgi:hypothetical protein
MELLIGLAMSAALLYFWLIGHWFARILVFLGLLALLGLIVIGWPNTLAPAVLLGLPVAWMLASMPIYVWHWRLRALQQDDAIRSNSVLHQLVDGRR